MSSTLRFYNAIDQIVSFQGISIRDRWNTFAEVMSQRQRVAAAALLVLASLASPSFRLGLCAVGIGIGSSLVCRLIEPYLSGRKPCLYHPIFEFFAPILQLLSTIPDTEIRGVIILPLVEEAIFRETLQPLLSSQLGYVAGIALTSYVFAVLHYQEERPREVYNTFIGGVLLGIAREKISIAGSIGFHAGFNAFWSIVHGVRNSRIK